VRTVRVFLYNVWLRASSYTWGDSYVIFSYHIYASSFPAVVWGKLWEMFVTVISLP